jgi:hypothetical protein
VAAVKDQQPAGQPGPKRQRGGKGAWQPAFSFEQALDAPCKFHSGAKPSNHTTRKCNWLARIAKGEALPPPPPAGQVTPAVQQPARAAGMLQDEFPEENATYVVFTSEANDKHSRR